MQFVDTHVHLTHPDYQADMAGLLDRAQKAGVTHLVCPGLDFASSQQAIALGQTYRHVIPAIGLHPESADEDLHQFEALAAEPIVKAIGEVGMDAKATHTKNQAERLRFFLELAIRVHKPVIIHIRDAWEPTLAILADYPALANRAVIHCFTGGPAEAKAITDLGLFISVTAIIARASLEPTRAVLHDWPLERLMLETDGPWLSWPGEPWPNEPTTVVKIVEFLAHIKELPLEQIATTTTQTAQHFFGL